MSIAGPAWDTRGAVSACGVDDLDGDTACSEAHDDPGCLLIGRIEVDDEDDPCRQFGDVADLVASDPTQTRWSRPVYGIP